MLFLHPSLVIGQPYRRPVATDLDESVHLCHRSGRSSLETCGAWAGYGAYRQPPELYYQWAHRRSPVRTSYS